MKGIPQKRLNLYILLLGLVPIFIVCLQFFNERSHLNSMEHRVSSFQLKAKQRKEKLGLNPQILQKYQGVDKYYLEGKLGALQFLSKELEVIEKALQRGRGAQSAALDKRAKFLKGSENRLVFQESPAKNFGAFKEQLITQARPVEINLKDLHKILVHVEGVRIGDLAPPKGRPHLIVTRFHLDRKKLSPKQEVMTLELKLLKRNYTP